MATSIEVNKKSVYELLKSWGKQKFIIPDYQRKYAREEEQCQTLWDDITHFSEQNKESTYFLWTVVSYDNEAWQQEIIDGQQRITTLFLLLRAIYNKLETTVQDDNVKGLMQQISPCIRDVNNITMKIEDFSNTHITSFVITDENNQKLQSILETGTINKDSKDNYSLNYHFFQECINDYSKENPMRFYDLCVWILHHCILLPIACDSQDTALTIFSTLNNRGLPLSDSDIFKAKLYNEIGDAEKNILIQQRQELDSITENAGIKIQDLFYYYMFYLRANEWDKDTTTPWLRKYFSRDNFKRLYNPELMTHLYNIADLWTIINNRQETEQWTKNIRIKQAFDILKYYPNEFWKYPTNIFYLQHHLNEDFENLFADFLENLFAVLCAEYVINPTVNAIKTKIITLNLTILNNPKPRISLADKQKEELRNKLRQPHRNILRMVMAIYTYKSQENLLPIKREVEHILPKVWQTTSLYGYEKNEVEPILDNIWNKIPLEKKLNIQAWNGYFNNKKIFYKQSEIQLARDLSLLSQNDRTPRDIENRNSNIQNNILDWFNDRRAFWWETHKIVPTEEDLRLIQKWETDKVEFKSSLLWNYKSSIFDRSLEHAVLKTISAFLNSKWWTLFIWVDNKWEVLWLQNDFNKFWDKNSDGFLLHLDNLIKNNIWANMHNFIDVQIKTIENKDIAIIDVRSSKEPVYLKNGNDEEFYIRAAASTQLLKISEMMKYIKDHRN